MPLFFHFVHVSICPKLNFVSTNRTQDYDEGGTIDEDEAARIFDTFEELGEFQEPLP